MKIREMNTKAYFGFSWGYYYSAGYFAYLPADSFQSN